MADFKNIAKRVRRYCEDHFGTGSIGRIARREKKFVSQRKITEAESVSLHRAQVASFDSFEQPIEATNPAPRYVFGPWVEGTQPLYNGAKEMRLKDGKPFVTFESRRAYRIGETYPHDGGECPLADGRVRVFAYYKNGEAGDGVHASTVFWPNVTSFTPLDEGKGV